MIEEKYCDTSLVYLNPLNKNVAKDLIIKNHYTHKWSLCTIAYGVYYKEYVDSTFFGGFNSKLKSDLNEFEIKLDAANDLISKLVDSKVSKKKLTK